MADVQVAEREAARSERTIRLVDCDVHTLALPAALGARLSERSLRHIQAFGARIPPPPALYPRMRHGGYRTDARPANGFAGSDIGVVQAQLLDEYDMDYAVLTPLQPAGFAQEAPEFAAELCRVSNDWTREEWLDRDRRLLGSICPPYEHADAAVEEIERLAGDERFVQVLLPATLEQGLGNRRYWPMLRATAEAGLPLALHTGGNPITRGAGWPSYYLDNHVLLGTTMAAQIVSMISAGVFEEIPELQVVSVECGIAWAAALSWAMDDAWRTFDEASVTKLKRPPSEYLREHFWFTTQPIEEPDDPGHLAFAFDALGMTDRILFATDYPHWDFDSPDQTLPRSISKDDRARIFAGNACRLYGLPRRDSSSEGASAGAGGTDVAPRSL
jgi:predicted TIM-barrel fold metal-dependent hydrolase